MRDPRMKEQLGFAREAGTRAMAKDFFAPTPGAGGGEAEAGAAPGAEAATEQASELEALSPEQLEELLALLAQQQEPPPEGQ